MKKSLSGGKRFSGRVCLSLSVYTPTTKPFQDRPILMLTKMSAEYGSHVLGAGDNNILVEEGGGIQKGTRRLTQAGDFDQGEAGERPQDILRKRKEQNPRNNELGRSWWELQDQVRGTPGGHAGAGAPVNLWGTRQN